MSVNILKDGELVRYDGGAGAITNIVTEFEDTPSDKKVPSEKLVKESLDDKVDVANVVTSWSSTPSNTKVPSEKLVKDNISTLQSNFQAGVDGVYNAIVAQGTTPSSKSLSNIKTGISIMATNKYNAGVDYGVKHYDITDTIFLCVGTDSYSYYSTDGKKWEKGNITGGANGVAYGNGKFVCVGSKYQTKYSTNMNNPWNNMYDGLYAYDTLNNVHYINGVFFAPGNEGQLCYREKDASKWTYSDGFDENYNLYDITYANGRYVCVGQEGQAYYSNTGADWTYVSGLGTNTCRGIAYGNGKFVAVGNKNNFGVSTDGTSWTITQISNVTRTTYNDIIYANGRFVCVGNQGCSYYSIDGNTWNEMTGLDVNYKYTSVTYANGRFVCVGKYGRSYYSLDGVTWIAMTGLDESYDYNSVVGISYL